MTQPETSSESKEEPPQTCSVGGCAQFTTPSGTTCENVHGGAPPLDSDIAAWEKKAEEDFHAGKAGDYLWLEQL